MYKPSPTLPRKLAADLAGLLILAFGVALSVKADLGVSPVSCIPYVYSLRFDLTIGELTILMNLLLVLAQVAILRRRYTLLHFSQLVSLTIFGYCIDFSLYLLSWLNPTVYLWQMLSCLGSCVLIAMGLFCLVSANVVYLPGDGLVAVVADTYKKEFGKLKVSFDSGMVLFGLASSLLFFGTVEGIREGTVIAALVVGPLIRVFKTKFPRLEAWLGGAQAQGSLPGEEAAPSGSPLVVTISREYGSGGHEIGRALAERLGIAFYDRELIGITAEESGFTEEYIRENEQKLARSLLGELYMRNYAYVKDELPPSDVLFLVQSKIIREIASAGPCVIVGRCTSFILKDHPRCFSVFIHANKKYRLSKIVNEYGVASAVSERELERLDRERAQYCLEYTGEHWKDAANYQLTLDSSLYGAEEAAEKIAGLIPQSFLGS
ncbi:MAG: DUF6198 family protein [Desulfovibrionaceae bacterium]